ncbi:5994_t:CDS:2 [Ambispora leptoticha]|uniref:5994_t:CDS:1 n=1 Tax=Ambispora leptoticha TaxID=144679 RepID=A0A9N9AWF7_9GLOM|nr:5994_t:CDS:2 [Ambispora leptoticha]
MSQLGHLQIDEPSSLPLNSPQETQFNVSPSLTFNSPHEAIKIDAPLSSSAAIYMHNQQGDTNNLAIHNYQDHDVNNFTDIQNSSTNVFFFENNDETQNNITIENGDDNDLIDASSFTSNLSPMFSPLFQSEEEILAIFFDIFLS